MSELPKKLENRIFLEDFLQGVKKVPDACIDMILCDLPYGTTKCKWDTIIPLDEMWQEFRRITKPQSAIVLTSAQPFTSILINSNIDQYKYNWIWEKSKATGYLNAKCRPLVAHEDILVFCKSKPPYYPLKTKGEPYKKGKALRNTQVYGSQKETLVENTSGERYPRSVIYFKTAESEGQVVHPTQKPLGLFDYLIRTYTKENDIVFDACMGSGTTAIAAINSGRRFLGFEKSEEYSEVLESRIKYFLPDFALLGSQQHG